DVARQARLFALVVAGVLLGIAPIHLARLVLDRVIPRRDLRLLAALGAAFLVAVLLRALVEYAQTMVSEAIRQRVIARLRSDLFAHLLRVGPDFYTRTPVGQIMNRVQTDVGR